MLILKMLILKKADFLHPGYQGQVEQSSRNAIEPTSDLSNRVQRQRHRYIYVQRPGEGIVNCPWYPACWKSELFKIKKNVLKMFWVEFYRLNFLGVDFFQLENVQLEFDRDEFFMVEFF